MVAYDIYTLGDYVRHFQFDLRNVASFLKETSLSYFGKLQLSIVNDYRRNERSYLMHLVCCFVNQNIIMPGYCRHQRGEQLPSSYNARTVFQARSARKA